MPYTLVVAMPGTERRQEIIRNPNPKVVLVGSFRYKEQIDEVSRSLQSEGIEVIAPQIGKTTGKISNYPVMGTESSSDPVEIQANFFISMADADAIYIVDPEGYTGIDAFGEIAFADIRGMLVIAMEPLEDDPADRFYQQFADQVITLNVESLVSTLKGLDQNDQRPEGYLRYIPKSLREPLTIEEARSRARFSMLIRSIVVENQAREEKEQKQ